MYPRSPDSNFKLFVYEQFSRVGKVLSASRRLILLNILCQGEHNVEALAAYSGLSLANVSRHLQVLKNARLVMVRKIGRQIFYRLVDEDAADFLNAFFNFAYKHLPELRLTMEQIDHSPTRVSAMKMSGLNQRLREENLLLIDVRPEAEFHQCHILGACSIPLEELPLRIATLPRDKEIVVYCRSRFCVLGDEAVTLLQQEGFRARRLESGLLHWKKSGLPVAASQDE